MSSCPVVHPFIAGVIDGFVCIFNFATACARALLRIVIVGVACVMIAVVIFTPMRAWNGLKRIASSTSHAATTPIYTETRIVSVSAAQNASLTTIKHIEVAASYIDMDGHGTVHIRQGNSTNSLFPLNANEVFALQLAAVMLLGIVMLICVLHCRYKSTVTWSERQLLQQSERLQQQHSMTDAVGDYYTQTHEVADSRSAVLSILQIANAQYTNNRAEPVVRPTFSAVPPTSLKCIQQSTRLAKDVFVEKTCVVCRDCLANVIFTDCRHLCSCHACSIKLATCPICRQAIIAAPLRLPLAAVDS